MTNDALLRLYADIVDDLEKSRIANENRLRQMTRDELDSDGEMRGLGLDENAPGVKEVAAIVDGIATLEKAATRQLEKSMKSHSLGPWVQVQRGVGLKQAARLLASIGDPYIRPEMELEDGTIEPERPRLVSELWQFCGHGDPERSRKKKGQKVSHSPVAKMRLWNVVASIVKAGGPWRDVYDQRKASTEGKLHKKECVRCGPSGKPAQPGSALSDGHRHADAMRITGKKLLQALWLEAQRLHD